MNLFIWVTVYYTVIFMAKNPKRVAAGKKAWKNRKKGGGARSGGGNSSRRKPIQRGLVGRFGAFMIGGVPPIVATVDVIADASHHHKMGANIMSVANKGLLRWVNNLTYGFFGVKAFGDYITMTKTDGSSYSTRPDAGVPKGAFLTTAVTGLGMMFFDTVASKLAGGRPVKIPFTNYNAIGGS